MYEDVNAWDSLINKNEEDESVGLIIRSLKRNDD